MSWKKYIQTNNSGVYVHIGRHEYVTPPVKLQALENRSAFGALYM